MKGERKYFEKVLLTIDHFSWLMEMVGRDRLVALFITSFLL
jgi:hypothetical protein